MTPIYHRPPQVEQNLSCRFKRRFATEKAAQAAHKEHRPYLCPHCGGWHLTSKGTKKPR